MSSYKSLQRSSKLAQATCKYVSLYERDSHTWLNSNFNFVALHARHTSIHSFNVLKTHCISTSPVISLRLNLNSFSWSLGRF